MAKVCNICKAENLDISKFCCICGMSLNEETDHYDGFISYRRDGGSETARLVKVLIENMADKKLFLDVDGLSTGLFDERLLRIIKNSENFILILSPGCLDRCGNEDDWLKREISYAIRHDRNIIPVMKEGFCFPCDKKLPSDIIKLPRYNAVPYNHKFIDATIRDILRFMRDEISATDTKAGIEEKSKIGNIAESQNNIEIITKSSRYQKIANIANISLSEKIVLDELRNKPDVRWTESVIENSVTLNHPEFSGNIKNNINSLIEKGYFQRKNTSEIAVTLKAIEYYRKNPRNYQ